MHTGQLMAAIALVAGMPAAAMAKGTWTPWQTLTMQGVPRGIDFSYKRADFRFDGNTYEYFWRVRNRNSERVTGLIEVECEGVKPRVTREYFSLKPGQVDDDLGYVRICAGIASVRLFSLKVGNAPEERAGAASPASGQGGNPGVNVIEFPGKGKGGKQEFTPGPKGPGVDAIEFPGPPPNRTSNAIDKARRRQEAATSAGEAIRDSLSTETQAEIERRLAEAQVEERYGALDSHPDVRLLEIQNRSLELQIAAWREGKQLDERSGRLYEMMSRNASTSGGALLGKIAGIFSRASADKTESKIRAAEERVRVNNARIQRIRSRAADDPGYRERVEVTLDQALSLTAILFEQGRLPESEMAARQAIQQSSRHAEAHNWLGRVLLKQQRWWEAESAFRNATLLQPREAVYHSNLGLALWGQQKWPQMEEAFRTAARLNGKEADYWMHAGLAALQQGRQEVAEAAMRDAAKRSRDDSVRLNQIAWMVVSAPVAANLRQTLARFALETAQRADTLAKGRDAAIADTLALAWFRAGDPAKALETQERAVRLAVGTPLNPRELAGRLEMYREAVGR